MNETDPHATERKTLLTRLLDAVKQCQVRFGGRSELATDADSRISCLCAVWEAALQHGLRKNNKALVALRQVTERAGLGKVTDFFSDIKHIETETCFWHYVKEHLTKHELQRFLNLKNINTESGRGRAWLRAALNEHSLERYMHMLLEKEDMLSHYYEDWAFIQDQERASMMPNMAAGLGSILFAINIDRSELNKSLLQSPTVVHVLTSLQPEVESEELKPVIAEDPVPNEKKKEKKKKKKVANIVSFDEDDGEGVPGDTDAVSNRRRTKLPSQNSDTATSSPDHHRTEDDVFPLTQNTEPKSMHPLLRASSGFSSSSFGSDHLSRSSHGSFSSEDAESSELKSTLIPVNASGAFLASRPGRQSSLDNHSVDSLSLSSKDDIENATLGLALAQRGMDNSFRTDGDGKNVDSLNEVNKDSMSLDELKQAVVTMMLRKDEVQEENRSLKAIIEQESDISAILRAEIAELKVSHAIMLELEQGKIQGLQKENELLKHQLKKYVNAVQLLRTEGAEKDRLGIHLEEPQPSLPPAKPMIDYSHEASEYEKKLIQVAEMHGELMEFNDLLHRMLNAREAVIRHLRQELVELRGPLPYSPQLTDESPDIEQSVAIQARALINIWIPSAFLQGTSSKAHHVYQVYIRIRDEEWNVYRRYSEFFDLHSRLKKVYPLVGKFDFPPKKNIGNKDKRVVEQRRLTFQQYLRSVLNLLLEKHEDLAVNACKEKLIAKLPFFSDKSEENSKKRKGRISRSPRPGESSSRDGTPNRNAEYSGL